jgi:hypothetical protein
MEQPKHHHYLAYRLLIFSMMNTISLLDVYIHAYLDPILVEPCFHRILLLLRFPPNTYLRVTSSSADVG